MFSLAADLGQFHPGVCAHISHDLPHPFQVPRGEGRVPVFRENQMDMQDEDTLPASTYVAVLEHETKYA